MSAWVYSVPGQTEGRRKACGDNVEYYKSVYHPIPTCENKEHPENKSVSSAFNWVSRYIFFLAKLKGTRRETTL